MGSSLLAPNWRTRSPKLLNINDVLIVQPIRYVFNEFGFETQLTAVCEGFMALYTDLCPLMDVMSERLQDLGKFGWRRIDGSSNGLVHLDAIFSRLRHSINRLVDQIAINILFLL